MYGPEPAGHWTSSTAPNCGRSYDLFSAGHRYRVIKPFKDYDGDEHPVGEEWTFLGYSFAHYDDGLSLFVSLDGAGEWQIRLQGDPDAQGHVRQHFEEHFVQV